MKNILIGGAWPYANGSLHIGHIAGLLPGDVLARYYRAKGENVFYVSGSDCHGTPITIRARQENRSPKEISEYYHKEFCEVFEKLGFSYDLYTKPATGEKFTTNAEPAAQQDFAPCTEPTAHQDIPLDRELTTRLNTAFEAVGTKIENGCFKDALETIFELVRFGNKYYDAHEPWKTRTAAPEKCAETLYNCTWLIGNLAVLLQPFLPFSSQKILGWLGLNSEWTVQDFSAREIPDDFGVLFTRI